MEETKQELKTEDPKEQPKKETKETKKTEKKPKARKKKPEIEIWATGRRKTAVARVKMVPGEGKITVNKMDYEKYFGGHLRYKKSVISAIEIIPEAAKFDYHVIVHGGGIMGHSEAIRLGMARAISFYNESFRPKLKAGGLLRRDPRMVERKKPGQPKARKKFQWTKR